MKKTLIVALTSALALSGSALISGARAEMGESEQHSTTTSDKTPLS